MTFAINRESNTITVANFWENHSLEKYNYEPVYQRRSVWTDEKQSFFIDSIIRNFPIPPIFLHQYIDDRTGKTRYDVVDGKQRLVAIRRFIEGEIPISAEFGAEEGFDEELPGIRFNDLDAPHLLEHKKRFWRYSIPVEYIDTAETKIIDDIFDRLNRNGEPLTGQELRNSKYHGTVLLNLIYELNGNTYWKQRLEHVDTSRMEDLEFISELVFELIDGEPLDSLPATVDSRYETYHNGGFDLQELRQEFEENTRFLENLDLQYEFFKIKGVSHLYSLWCFAQHCNRSAVDVEQVRGKIHEFFSQLRAYPSENECLQSYKRAMSSATKSRIQRVRRLEALVSYCL